MMRSSSDQHRARAAPAFTEKAQWILIGAVAGVTLLMLAALAFVVNRSTDRTPRSPGAASINSSTQPPVATGQSSPVRPPATGTHNTGTSPAAAADTTPTVPSPDLLGALRALPDQWRGDHAGALSAWRALQPRIAAEWCDLAAADLSPANAAVAEFLRIVAYESPSDLAPAIEPLTASVRAFIGCAAPPPVASVKPLAWSFGMLARLAMRDDLGAGEARRQAISLIEGAVGPQRRSDDPFGDHALALLGVIADRSMPGVDRGGLEEERRERWSRWARVLAALGARSAAARAAADACALDVAEALLRKGADPSMNSESRAVLRTLFDTVADRASAGMRERVMRWLAAPEIKTPPLSEALACLAEIGNVLPAQRADDQQAMVLSPTAGPIERDAIARLYAKAWGFPDARPTDLVAEQWAESAAQQAEQAAPGEPLRALADAARSALFNASAAALWKADEASARQNLRAVASRPDELLAAGASAEHADAELVSLTATGRPPDGQWAVRYLAGQIDHDARIALLNELLRTQQRLGPVDAGVLAHAATLGPTPEIRAAAQCAVRTQASSLPMLHALMQSSIQLPRQDGISDMIKELTTRDLPKPEDPAWPSAVRAAIVDRMLHVVARSRAESMDRFEALFTECFEAQCEPSPASTPKGEPAAPEGPAFADPLGAAEALRREWDARAAALVPGEFAFAPLTVLRRTHDSRRALAQGPMQRLSAEGASIAEVMAYVVAGERVSRAKRVAAIVDELRARRRTAPSVQHQIAANERAMLKLWAIRLGREPSGGGT